MPTKAKYGTPGVLAVRAAIGLPGTEEYQESTYVIRDRPDDPEDAVLREGQQFSVYSGTIADWIDVYLNYSEDASVICRNSDGEPLTEFAGPLHGQIRARLRLT